MIPFGLDPAAGRGEGGRVVDQLVVLYPLGESPGAHPRSTLCDDPGLVVLCQADRDHLGLPADHGSADRVLGSNAIHELVEEAVRRLGKQRAA